MLKHGGSSNPPHLISSYSYYLRQQSTDSSQTGDVFTYLESDASYQCRTHVKQTVRLVRVIVSSAPVAMPAVDISMSGTNLPTSVIRPGLGAVQSFVLHP